MCLLSSGRGGVSVPKQEIILPMKVHSVIFRDIFGYKQVRTTGIYSGESENRVAFPSVHRPGQHREVMAATLSITLSLLQVNWGSGCSYALWIPNPAGFESRKG